MRPCENSSTYSKTLELKKFKGEATVPANANDLVTVSQWNACYNAGENIISLSCRVTTIDSSATIEGVGLILNTSKGMTLASSYTEFADSQTVNPALNLPSTGLSVGDSVRGVVSGEVGGQHYFFEQELTIGNC